MAKRGKTSETASKLVKLSSSRVAAKPRVAVRVEARKGRHCVVIEFPELKLRSRLFSEKKAKRLCVYARKTIAGGVIWRLRDE